MTTPYNLMSVPDYEEIHTQLHEEDDRYYNLYTYIINKVKWSNYYNLYADVYNWNSIYEIMISCANYVFTFMLLIALILYYISMIV